MTSRKLNFGLILGTMVLLLVAGLAIAIASTQTTAQAAPAAQATATTVPATSPAATTAPATKQPDDKAEANKYLDAFTKDLATRLGVSEDKLNSAFAGAIGGTLDQMVKDGKISQAEADKIKTMTKDGFKGFMNFPFNLPGKAGPGGVIDNKAISSVIDPAIESVAQVLNLTPDALKQKLGAGQSLAAIAQAQNVELQKVKDALLASVKTQLDKLVKDGKLTQAQADAINQQAPMIIEKIVNSNFMGKGGKQP